MELANSLTEFQSLAAAAALFEDQETLKKARAADLIAKPVRDALVEHAAGNYRVMMTAAGELLLAAAEREVAQIDEKLYFEIFDTRTTRRSAARARSRA